MARLAILTLFMGQTRNRFLQYQQPRTILEILDMAGRTEGCEGVELRYPGDLADPQAVKAALAAQQPRHRRDQLRLGAARPVVARRVVVDQAGGAPGRRRRLQALHRPRARRSARRGSPTAR